MPANDSHRKLALSQVGVSHVILGLVESGWSVYRPAGERGFDLLAERQGSVFRIEVKSFDALRQIGKNARHGYVTSGPSKTQRLLADYLAVYVHGYSTVVMIPIRDPVASSCKSRNGLKVGAVQSGAFSPRNEFMSYQDNFELRHG